MKHITHESNLNTQREISLLELAAIVIKRDILESTTREHQEDIEDIIDELVDCRANELVKHDKKIKYTFETEAFTCEICDTALVVTKHKSVDKAIRFALENIANIHIVFKGEIVVIGGKSYRKFCDIQNDNIITEISLDSLTEFKEKIYILQ